MMIPPATAAEANSMARNKSPLPRNTVAKKRSSKSPRRSRSTAMNHKKAMPAKGTRFGARATVFELVLSHAPVSSGSARTESRNSKRPRNQENRKEDAGDGGGARRLQPRTDQGCVLLHLALTTAFWLIDRCNLVAVPPF